MFCFSYCLVIIFDFFFSYNFRELYIFFREGIRVVVWPKTSFHQIFKILNIEAAFFFQYFFKLMKPWVSEKVFLNTSDRGWITMKASKSINFCISLINEKTNKQNHKKTKNPWDLVFTKPSLHI